MATSRPPPRQAPWMAATTGLLDFSTSKRRSWQPFERVVASSAVLHRSSIWERISALKDDWLEIVCNTNSQANPNTNSSLLNGTAFDMLCESNILYSVSPKLDRGTITLNLSPHSTWSSERSCKQNTIIRFLKSHKEPESKEKHFTQKQPFLTLISAPAMKHPGFPDISTADLAEPSAMNCKTWFDDQRP